MIGKKGKQAMNPWVVVLVAAAVIYVVNPAAFSFLQSGGGDVGTGDTDTSTIVVESCAVTSPTVKFSGIDMYTQGTSVSQGHRILQLDGEYNAQVANAGTKDASVGDPYKVLLGNLTTTLTAGTDYYPEYRTGTIGCDGAPSLTGLLPKTQAQTDTIFTFWNDNAEANTAQSISTNQEKTVRIRFAASDNKCFGNPHAEKMGGSNVMCFTYATDAISSVELVGGTGATRPKSASAVAGNDTVCYKWPVICDNADWEGKMVIKSGSTEPTSGHNISISLHDVSFDYDADTLALIVGVEDEAKTRNDIGVTDFNTGADWDYSVSLS